MKSDPKSFTILFRDWIFTPEELWNINPHQLIRRFLRILQRADVYRKRGYIFVGLHGEFNRNTGCFHLHLHGIADGEMVNVVRGLKKLPRFRFDRKRDLRSPIRVTRLRMTNLPYPLLYTVQDWWPGRFILVRNGKPVRSRRQRIPEPYHTLLLLWLDRWSLADMILMVGIRAGKHGFAKRA
ncbi:hypothetical protein IL54_1815 [Sphingobium sp. ba1]|uniref:hypothetical protein n=1 Tax=Sphingobium sp. ba1 TaxID=1522072 RepID=UPI000502A62B|nr:hypothetical protein [Sphingobium sp. ba1]KFL46399.1 hypothetical protein IL54_1815 [Sphingobium sp. ba1]